MQASQVVLDLTHTSSLDAGETASGGTNGTRVDSSGNIVTATTPRFDYNPATLAAKGLLIEGERTNLLLYNTALDNAAHVKARTTVTADAATGPDNAANADKIVENTDTNSHLIYQTITYTSATEYSASIYAAPAERSVLNFFFPTGQGFAGDFGLRVNLATGTSVTTGTPATRSSVTDAYGAFYLISITATTNATSGRTPYTALGTVATAPAGLQSYTGDGSSGLYAWGGQLEVGAFSSSLIFTSGSTVTRTADSIVRSGTNFSDYWDASAISVAIKFDSPGVGTRTVWQSDDNTANERICLYTTGTTLKLMVVDGGSTVADITVGTITAYQQHWCAFRIEANNVAASLDGAAVGTDTSVTLPTVDRRRLGASTVAGEELFGHISREIWIDGALTDGELRFLSRTGTIPVMSIDAVAYTLTLANVGMLRHLKLAIDAVAYALTLANVGFLRALKLAIDAVAYALTLADITFRLPAVTPASRRFTPPQSLASDRRFTVAASRASSRRFTVEE